MSPLPRPPLGTVRLKQVSPNLPKIAMAKFAEARINGGMFTMVDPADLQNNQLQKARNVNVRFDKTNRRDGTVLLTPDKPDSNPVLRLGYAKLQNGNNYTLRFTRNSVHLMGSGSWTAVTGTLAGTDSDFITTAIVLDQIVFSNNGANNIQLIDPLGPTFADLGNAGNYRYITGFGNRVVGAALAGTNEVLVGWSANGVIDEWNPATNETAGSSPLVESPSDLGDFISGIFGYTNQMIILREKSIWLANKQPIPSNPFYFYAAVPGIGCDAPKSASIITGGIAWLDTNSRTVWAFSPGSTPEPIGRSVENDIFKNLDNPRSCFSSYNPIHNEYTVCIPKVGTSIVVAWTYNFRTRCWFYSEYDLITCIDDSELGFAGVTIDELGDVPIDSLTGTIDELSPTKTIAPIRTFGRSDGEILMEDGTAVDDAGTEYETEIVSKAYYLPTDDMYVAEVRIEYQQDVAGEIELQYSKNGGATDASWKLAKVIESETTKLGEPKLLIWKKQVKTRRFAWKLYARGGKFSSLSYEVHVYKSGESRAP